jgi:hypothetical protein
MKNFDPPQEISFEGDEEPSPEFRSHMLDAFAHAAGHGPDPGRYRPKPEKPEDTKEGPADTKPQESFEAFCKRLGIKHNTKQGGIEFCPGTFLAKQLESQPKRPKRSSSRESD